jgi:alkylation response protein AidB-like acyl-CoA dehydrogenase
MATATAVAAPVAAATASVKKAPKPLPAPNSDFYELYETLNAEELATVKRVRTFMEAKVAPVITKYWVDDAFPFELLPAVKELGIGGLGMKGYGCVGGSLALLGFVQMEIARTDPSFATFMGVHIGLADMIGANRVMKSSKNSKANRTETGERSGGIGEICSVEVDEK